MAAYNEDLLQQVFADDITENQFPSNSFMARARKDDTALANRGIRKVQLAQIDTGGTIVEDDYSDTTTPAERIPTVTDYALNFFRPEAAIKLSYVAEMDTNVALRQAILSDEMSKLQTAIGNRALYNWGSRAISVLRTTGTNRAAEAPGATGNRKAFTLADFRKGIETLVSGDIPMDDNGLFSVLSPRQYFELTGDDRILNSAFLGKTSSLAGAPVTRLENCDIYVRSKFLRFTNAATPVAKQFSAMNATSDNAAAIFMHESFLRKAKPAAQVMITPDARVMGDILNFFAYAGFAPRYTDGRGIVAVVEGV